MNNSRCCYRTATRTACRWMRRLLIGAIACEDGWNGQLQLAKWKGRFSYIPISLKKTAHRGDQ